MTLTLEKTNLEDLELFAPYLNISESNLSNRISRFFHVSCDAKDTWTNGIFHNSRYGIFHLYQEGNKFKLELTSKGLNTVKFRKATVTSEKHALMKIKTWTRIVRGLE